MRRLATSCTDQARFALANEKPQRRGETTWRCRREGQERNRSRKPRTKCSLPLLLDHGQTRLEMEATKIAEKFEPHLYEVSFVGKASHS
jgi:hypothetical protein